MIGRENVETPRESRARHAAGRESCDNAYSSYLIKLGGVWIKLDGVWIKLGGV